MATQVNSPGANYSGNKLLIPYFPVEGAVAFFLLGDSAAASRRNLITNSDATVVGSPTYNAGHIAASSANGIDSGLSVAGAVTIFGVFQYQQQCFLAGQYASASAGGINTQRDGIYSLSNNWTSQIDGNALSIANPSGSTYPGWRFLAVTNSNSGRKFYLYDDDAAITVSGAGFPNATNTTFKIGGYGSPADSNFVQTHLAACGGIFNAQLSDAQIDVLYLDVKARLAERSIAIA